MTRLIATVLPIVGILWLADAYLLARFSDFWSTPDPLHTKAGVFAYELLLLASSTLLVSLPALLIAKFLNYRIAKSVAYTGILLVLFFLLLGWSFYGLFEKFIGVFALQMIMQDGGQLIAFVGKMPSSVDYRLMTEAVLILVVITYLYWSGAGHILRLRKILSVVTTVALVPAVAVSVLWNKPVEMSELQDARTREVFNKVSSASFDELYAKAGPLVGLYSSFTDFAFDNELVGAVDPSMLEPRAINNLQAMYDEDQIKKYNIVFVLVESLHPDMLSAFRGSYDVMPTVNELSKRGYVLTNAWAQASHSNYADVAALSGQYPLRSNKVHFYAKNPGYPKSLPYDMLRPLGYKVGLFSSQNEHWGLMSNYLNSDSIDIFSHVGGTFGSGSKKPNLTVKVNDQGSESLSYSNFMYRGDSGGIERLDEVTVKAASDWLALFDHNAPVFMYFNFQASHSPFNALPENYERVFLTDENAITQQIKKGKIAAMPKDYVIAAYKDSLHYVDQNISEIVNQMKRTGRHENTIYVISADTSYDFNGRILGNGGALNSEVLRIPVVISVPGMTTGEIIDSPAEQIDIMPTVLSLVGVGPHPASQGVNVIDIQNPERIVFSVAQTPVAHQYAAVYKNWQLVHDKDSDSHALNYVGMDPTAAKNNLLTEEKVEWLVSELAAWRNRQLAYYSSPSIYSQYNPPKIPTSSRALQTAEEELN